MRSPTLCLFVDHEAASDTTPISYTLIYTMPTSQKIYRPKIFIRSQQRAIFAEATEAHAVGMGLQNAVPPPKHVAVDVVRDAVVALKKEGFGGKDGGVSTGDGPSVYGFWVGAF
jgi:hypothetical protein